jgi:hypothetical protein
VVDTGVSAAHPDLTGRVRTRPRRNLPRSDAVRVRPCHRRQRPRNPRRRDRRRRDEQRHRRRRGCVLVAHHSGQGSRLDRLRLRLRRCRRDRLGGSAGGARDQPQPRRGLLANGLRCRRHGREHGRTRRRGRRQQLILDPKRAGSVSGCRRRGGDGRVRPAGFVLELRLAQRVRLGARRRHLLDLARHVRLGGRDLDGLSLRRRGRRAPVRRASRVHAGRSRRVLAASSDKVGGVLYGSDPYSTCDGCTWNSSYGYGRVDVAKTLALATAPAPTSSPLPASPPPPPFLPAPPPPRAPAPPAMPVPKTPDTVPPFVRAYPVTGRRGRMVKLTYRVRDNSGDTTEQVSIYRGRTLVTRIDRTLRPTEDTVVYWVPWRSPRQRLLGRFCVRAADGAANASTSCASLRTR